MPYIWILVRESKSQDLSFNYFFLKKLSDTEFGRYSRRFCLKKLSDMSVVQWQSVPKEGTGEGYASFESISPGEKDTQTLIIFTCITNKII